MDIKKLYGIMPALMTAFDSEGIDRPSVARLIHKMKENGVDGFY